MRPLRLALGVTTSVISVPDRRSLALACPGPRLLQLPELGTEHSRPRVLSADEIRIFWHGLDRADLPWDQRTRLALKFDLVTMLRSAELLGRAPR